MRPASSFHLILALLLGFGVTVGASATTTIPSADDGATVTTYAGGTCVGCDVGNEHRVIDASLSNFATVAVPAGVDGLVGISVFFAESMSAGHRVAFVLDNATGIFSADILDAVTLQTYADGELRESVTGQDNLTAELLTDGHSRVRFKTTEAFDEIRILVHGRVDAATNLQVFYALATIADRDGGVYIPTVSDGATVNSGTSALCVGCSVDDEANVISDDLMQSATMTIPVGLAVDVWIEVGYPTVQIGGTKTGMILFDVPGLANDELLDGLRLTTYRNGAEQESVTGDTGLQLAPDEEDKINLAFRPSQDFDAVRVTVAGTLGAEVELRVQNAYSIPRVSNKAGTEAAPVPVRRASGALSAPAPNPSAGLAQAWLEVDGPQHVLVRLLDVRGREIATLFDGHVEAATPVAIDGRDVPSGVYLIVAEGETFVASRRLSVVR